MKIIASLTPATTAPATPALAQNIKLSVIPVAGILNVSHEELTKIKDQLQTVQDDLKRWRQECQQEFAKQIVQVKQEWRTQMETWMENTKKSAAPLEDRLAALEQSPRFVEERMVQKIKESVKSEVESIRIPPPPAAPTPAPQDAWDSDLKRKERTLQDLKAELAKIPATVPVIPKMETKPPVPAVLPLIENRPGMSEAAASLNVDGLKKHLTQESTYGTSSRTSSIFAKLWLYLNEPAIEIPLKNTKNS